MSRSCSYYRGSNPLPMERPLEQSLGLKCRECGRSYPSSPVHVCEFCFGPLEVDYDYGAVRARVSRARIEAGPRSIWRYAHLLPVALPADGDPPVGQAAGFTPLIRARNLGEELGVTQLHIKNDSVCHPTWSFKDRVVSVAVAKAREFGFDTVACASTGNLANSVAAHAAEAHLKAYVFIPTDLEQGKVTATLVYDPVLVAVQGTYDEVNRLCSEVADKYRWAFVNINLRPYYGEGSKTVGYEIAEQLGWRAPAHVVVPCAGGALLTKIARAFHEMQDLGLIPAARTKMYAAQALSCGLVRRPSRQGLRRLRRARDRGRDRGVHATARAHRGDLRRDGGRGDGGGDPAAHRGRPYPARRAYRDLHHRQRAQDSGRAARPPVRQREHTAPALGLRPGTGRSQIEGRHRMSVLVRIHTPAPQPDQGNRRGPGERGHRRGHHPGPGAPVPRPPRPPHGRGRRPAAVHQHLLPRGGHPLPRGRQDHAQDGRLRLHRARDRRRPVAVMRWPQGRMRVRLTFPPDFVRKPVVYHLVKDFDLVANIRRADVQRDHGWVVLELEGSEDRLHQGVAWLKQQGVTVDPIERDVVLS